MPVESYFGHKSFVIPYSLFPIPCFSVVVRTAQVVPAVRTNQLALVPRQAVRTGGADLAVVVDGRLLCSLDAGRANRTTL